MMETKLVSINEKNIENNREKIAWGIVFLLIPVISTLIFYLVKGITNKGY